MRASKLGILVPYARVYINVSSQAVAHHTTRDTTAEDHQQRGSPAKLMLRGGPLGKCEAGETCPGQHCDRAAILPRVRIVSARRYQPDRSPPVVPTPSPRQRSPRSFMLTRGHSRSQRPQWSRPSSTCIGYSIARAVSWSSTAGTAPSRRSRRGGLATGQWLVTTTRIRADIGKPTQN